MIFHFDQYLDVLQYIGEYFCFP